MAIRDPLSGRSYVYRYACTGAADPRRSLEETIKGKLPQRKITRKDMSYVVLMVTRLVC